jgi:hypothetical protein
LMKTENDYRKENMNFTFIIKIVRSQLWHGWFLFHSYWSDFFSRTTPDPDGSVVGANFILHDRKHAVRQLTLSITAS